MPKALQNPQMPYAFAMADIGKLHLTRPRLLARLPETGAAGRTCYRAPGDALSLHGLALDAATRERLEAIAGGSATGSALFADADEATLVLPPFAVEASNDWPEMHPTPLVDVLARPRPLAVLLLRRGGFTIGFFRGDFLVDSKTDQRFVKGRHRKGGQSSRRFERVREGQVRQLLAACCETAKAKLTLYDAEIEHVFLGGDRLLLMELRRRCECIERFGARLMPRILPVAGDPRLTSLRAAPREIWASDVYAASLARREEY